MTLYFFNALPYELQLIAVFEAGTFLATRWEEENEAVNLCHLLGGVFIEVYYNTHNNEITRLESFVSSDPLEDYAVSVRLPAWLSDAT